MKQFLALTVCIFSLSTSAAEITRVASSFEDKKPFGMFLDFTFNRMHDRGRLVREWYQQGALQDVTELRYQRYDTSLGLDVHLGIYKDLEIHVGAPIIFQQDRTWNFAAGTNEGNTTILRNCTDARGNLCATPGGGNGALFDVNNPNTMASFRSGLGDFTFGIAWSPFVQKKDASKPNWLLRFDYTAPTAALLNPSQVTSSSARGNVGDKIHRYTFSTSVSKRLGAGEPYFQIHYTLPWRGPGYYSNCDSTNGLGRAENCGGGPFNREETGIRPAHVGGIKFGSEVLLFENEAHHQRFKLDFGGWLTYTSESRAYNEISDLFGKLLYTSDYGQAGAQFGFVAQAAEFVSLKASTSFAYNTERFLTNESIGKDWVEPKNETVDITAHPEEINPNFDNRVDRVGRRFRIQEQFIFRILVTATFNF
jgi:hypothetical protein